MGDRVRSSPRRSASTTSVYPRVQPLIDQAVDSVQPPCERSGSVGSHAAPPACRPRRWAPSTTTAAVITTRSAIRGIPSGRSFLPSAFGIHTRRTASARYVFLCSFSASSPSQRSSPYAAMSAKSCLVHPRCALVGLAPIVGVPQHVLAIQLVVQKVEPVAGAALAFACNAICSFSNEFRRVGRLIVNPCGSCRVRAFVLKQGPFPRPPLRGFTGTMGPSVISGAATGPHGFGVAFAGTPGIRLPLLHIESVPCVLPPIPRWNRRVHFSSLLLRRRPSPWLWGRVGFHGVVFGGLLGVHCALRPACSPSYQSDPLHQRLQPFRHLHDCSDCYRPERKLPGGSVLPTGKIAPLHGAQTN